MSKTCSIDRNIGARVRRKREEHGVTPSDFASAVGISERALLDFEVGADRIDARIMMRLCKALGVSATYFFEHWAPTERGQTIARPQGPRRSQSFAKALLEQIGHLARRVIS